jgi:hypothetical protein
MIKKTILIYTFLIVAIAIKAQDSKDTPEQIIKEYFQLVKKSKIKEATTYIFSTNKFMRNSQDQINSISQKLETDVSQFGELFSEEQITKASAGPNLVTYAYLAKYDRQPLRFIFTFYKPKDSWRLYFFKYDDQADDELLDAIRSDRLMENFKIDGN